MHRPTRLKMTDLNPHLNCVLCDGYFVDATTIVECLHSFCRACIVKYLETNKFCPICDVQVHKTKPLLSIRSDKTLQDVVYKLVPGLYQNEMKRRIEFYAGHPEEAARCTSEERGEGANQRFIYTPDETISLSLEYGDGKESNHVNSVENSQTGADEIQITPKRYLQCPAAITVGHLKKFINSKYALPLSYMVEITYSGDVLNEEYTLMDIAYIYAWRRSGPMRFFYRINPCPAKRQKTCHRRRIKSAVPLIKEQETVKKSSDVPTLRLLPSPLSVPHEFKFVLKTVSKKEEKNVDSLVCSGINQHQKQSLLRDTIPLNSHSASFRSSTSPSSSMHEVCPSKQTLASISSPLNQTNSIPKESTAETIAVSHTPATTCAVPHSVAVTCPVSHPLATLPDAATVTCTVTTSLNSTESRTALSALPSVVSKQNLIHPVVCSSYCQPVTTKSGPKRATRSRIKNRLVQRPLLAKLAPYPPPSRTSSPTANALSNPVNPFPSSQVACFTAPPATCLSTPPVSCLGAVSVNYLPAVPVTCFGATPVNGASNLNVNNLVSSAVNSVPMTSLSCLPVINPSTQSTAVAAPITSDVVASNSSSIANSVSMPVNTLPKTFVTMPVVSSECMPVTTTATYSSESRSETAIKTTSVVNTSLMATVSLAVAPKMMLSKITKDTKPPKNVTLVENHEATVASISPNLTCSSIEQTPATSDAVASNSFPVTPNRATTPNNNTPVNVSLLNTYIPSSTSQPVASNSITACSKSSNVSFSVSSLLPNVTSTQKTADTKADAANSSAVVLVNQSQDDHMSPCNSVSQTITESDTKEHIDNEVPQKPLTPGSNVESRSLSSISTEKKSINIPFKEVKSSITAEFSDNDDLGCQPDLVVDEQKIDSSENEDEGEEALRKKITAIAEKDDEVDVDTETDSGRASDISNQARSSCDDDIGSPSAAVRTTEPERTLHLQPSTVNVLSTNFVTPTSSALTSSVPHRIDDGTAPCSKPNVIEHIINTLHRNHERKDNIGALDLSTSCRKPGDETIPRPRPRPVANPPVLDAKHRQQTCLPAPTKQHTACVPAPKHPTSSTFHIGPLSTSARHSMIAAASQNHLSKLPPVTVPHFTPTPHISTLSVKTSNSTHFCRTPPMPIPSSINPYQGKPVVNYRQGNSAHSRSHNNCSPPASSSSRKSPSAASCSTNCTANGRREVASPRNSAPSPSAQPSSSPHQRVSPCVTPPKSAPSSTMGSHLSSMPPLVPSTSTYKVTRPPIPIYKKSDSYKNSSHHNRFKGSNLTVINPDPNGFRQRIVIKNLDSRPNSHNNHHRL